MTSAGAASEVTSRGTVADYGIRIGAPLYFRHESSLEHDTGPHPERSGRIPAIERAMEARDWLGFELRDAPEATIEEILRVHPPAHVEHVRLACERGVSMDADTPTSPGSWGAALHAAGGAVAMIDALVGGEARLAFCGLRPPGHHAESHAAMGFCLFNNIAVATRHALDRHGLQRVFILDWDVHHGNGTNEVFHETSSVLFASIHQSPLYPGSGPLSDVGAGDGEGFSLNLPVPPGSGESEWLSLVQHVVAPAAREFEPELVLVSAGFDAHRADPLAGCMLETESYAELAGHVRELAGELDAPVGVVLEGGYDLDALASSVVAALGTLTDGARPPRLVERDAISERAASAIGRYWRL
jgi:acetoin utilization deacetylase AcuC-like enzyme